MRRVTELLDQGFVALRPSRNLGPLALAAAFVLVLNSPVSAVVLSPGDILVSGGIDGPGLIHVDPATRNRVYVSGQGVGVGPELEGPTGIAVLGKTAIFVADAGPAILRVDPATGDRTVVSGVGVGVGQPLMSASGLWLRDDNSLLVLDYAGQSVLSVDIASGDRTVISSPSMGVGPLLLRPNDVATTLDGRILVTSLGATTAEDEFNGSVISIDPATGNRSILADVSHGSGPGFIAPLGITRTASGRILVTDNWAAKIFEVDPATGDRTVFSESSGATPVNNQFGSPFGISAGPDGSVYFLDFDFGVMRIDANGGLASRFSYPGIGFGEGPSPEWAQEIAVVQVPEPAGIVTAIIGIMALLASRSLRRRE